VSDLLKSPYSPTGGRIDVIIQPAVQAQRVDGLGQAGDASFWEIGVCDFGMGIPEEHLERIFDPFYRVDTRLTREQYGLGLGLTACKRFVALHQGRIWAESCPDGGSAFHVWLPREGPIVTS
jgi:signal transduction histidine kinase